jgi:hypothetical protein
MLLRHLDILTLVIFTVPEELGQYYTLRTNLNTSILRLNLEDIVKQPDRVRELFGCFSNVIRCMLPTPWGNLLSRAYPRLRSGDQIDQYH